MDRGKDPLLQPYTYNPSSSTVGLLLDLNIIREVNPQFSEFWGNVNVFRGNQVTIIYWLITRIRKFRFLRYTFFLKTRNSPQVPSLIDIVLGNFSLSNLTIFMEDLLRWKRRFEIFSIDHCTSDIANKSIASKYRNIVVSVASTLY